jgi:hypothetical protein
MSGPNLAETPQLKDHPQIRRYLQDCREGLILDIAGSEDKLTEAQRILIDRIISKLSICRLIEIYIEKHGIFRKDKLDKRILELEPALGVNYLAFNNSIRLALGLLGINKRHSEEILTPIELAQRIEEEKRRREE